MMMMRPRIVSPALQRNLRRCLSRAASSHTTINTNNTKSPTESNTKIPISFLDLHGSGLSVLERLLLEECLFQQQEEHDRQSWVIAGYHDATKHRYLNMSSTTTTITTDPRAATRQNDVAAIVMGIGGKPQQLLHVDRVRRDGVLTIKRFSGGGTVVMDHDSIWTTVIGRPEHFDAVDPYPRHLMEYTAQSIFAPLFQKLNARQRERQQQEQQQSKERRTLVWDTKSCAVENTGRVVTIPSKAVSIPNTTTKLYTTNQQQQLDLLQDNITTDSLAFALRENDYVLGERKMGGNAQSIGKNGWLHHTSFLWDYQEEHMRDYLSLPKKRPQYRGDRSHDDFLIKLSQVYPALKKSEFVNMLRIVCEEQFAVQHVTVREAMEIVQKQGGGLQAWWEEKSRTKLVHDLKD